jgi:hypothetical protein
MRAMTLATSALRWISSPMSAAFCFLNTTLVPDARAPLRLC